MKKDIFITLEIEKIILNVGTFRRSHTLILIQR
jgi:hypothetical protein